MQNIKTYFKNFRIDLNKDSTKFLILLLSADLMFILMHISYVFYDFKGSFNSIWSIETDHGLAEAYQYVKEFWVIIIIGWITIKYKRYSLVTWVLVFIYILSDDMFTLHERYGDKLSSFLGYSSTWGLRAEDMGEITFFALFGFTFLILIGLSYFYSRKDRIVTSVNRILILVFGFLAFFGIAIDAIHSMFVKLSGIWEWPRIIRLIIYFSLGIIEDGGEMIVMSFAVWYVFRLINQVEKDQMILVKQS